MAADPFDKPRLGRRDDGVVYVVVWRTSWCGGRTERCDEERHRIGHHSELGGVAFDMDNARTNMADAVIGPVTRGVETTPPFGKMGDLSPEELRREQQVSLVAPRRKYSVSARLLFGTLDLVYGTGRNLEKFRVLELAARVPYQAWEHVAYVAVTHKAHEPGFANRIFTNVRAARRQQDNEQWHLLILEELLADEKRRYGWLRTVVFPQLLALVYYQLSWLLFVFRPDWSYRLNADFEDHAEHEYAALVEANPAYESLPFVSQFTDEYGRFDSVADLFRQIGYDERIHKLESIARMKSPRFS